MLTPYQFASNSPISGIDLDGLEYSNANTGDPLGPLSQESLESTEVTIVDSRTLESETIVAHLPGPTVVSTPLTKRDRTSGITSIDARPFRSSASESLWEDSKEFGDESLNLNIETSVVSFDLYSHPIEGPNVSFGVNYTTLKVGGDFSADLGTEHLKLIASGEGNVLKAGANIDAGWMTGQQGKSGPLLDVNAGAYSAQGDLNGGINILGMKITGTMGGSVGSVHIGITGGATYSEDSGILTIQGMEHVGFGVGEKFGGTIEIPVRDYSDMFHEFISDK